MRVVGCDFMHLFEAILDANQRAVRGESAGLHPSDFTESLPVVALTCIDPRLNPLMPEVLGLPEAHFIWLRNAGNIITGPTSSTMRSIALACAVKGGREIAVIGHTDCRVKQTSASELIDRLRALGIERAKLPDNLNEFFGLFASERTNVMKAVEFIRHSPLIGPRVPVHGLMVDIQTGQLEWLVNGYNALASGSGAAGAGGKLNLPDFHLGTMKFPEMKIGEIGSRIETPREPPAPHVPPPVPRAEPVPRLKMHAPEVIPVPPRIARVHPKPR
jgi:carbonic anhydrase